MDYFDSNSEYDKSELPEGFGWEDMKEGIQEKMDKTKVSPMKKWWPLMLLLLIGGCGSWLSYDHFFKTQPDEKEFPIAETNSNEQTAKELISSPEEAKPIREKKEENITAAKMIAKNTTAPKALAKSNAANIKKENNPKIADPKGRNVEHTETAAVIFSEDKYPRPSKLNNKTKKQPASELPIKPLHSIAFLKPLPILFLETEEEMLKLELLPLPVSKIATQKEKAPRSFSGAILGGIQNWKIEGSDNINKDYTSGFPGYTFSSEFNYHLSPAQSLSIAYQYQFLQELFEYEGSRIEEKFIPDFVESEVINSLTGASISSIKKDTFTEVTHYNKELKYNKYQLHSLQLSFNQQVLKFRKSHINLSIGGTYLFALNAKGKRLDDQWRVRDFNQDSPMFKSQHLAIKAALSYHYHLSPQMSLVAHLQGQQYLTNWENSPEFKGNTRPLTYGLMLGLQRKF